MVLTKKKDDVKDIIGRLSNGNYPQEDEESFQMIFNAICDTYDLKNPVDQLIANRATTQILLLQYCQDQLKRYGLFNVDKDDNGNDRLTMNQLAYFMKQVESEFRSNIRMLRQTKPKNKEGDSPDNFAAWLGDGKKKSK